MENIVNILNSYSSEIILTVAFFIVLAIIKAVLIVFKAIRQYRKRQLW